MPPRAGLDRASVVQADAQLVDDPEGELTLGALATRLGVRTPSLYNHVEGLDGLHRELALMGTRELGAAILRAAAGRSGDEALFCVARAYRDYARARPGLYRMTQRAPEPDDAEIQAAAAEIIEVLAAILRAYGLEGDDAIHAIRGLRSLLHGFVSLEGAGGFGIPIDPGASFERSFEVYIKGLRALPVDPR